MIRKSLLALLAATLVCSPVLGWAQTPAPHFSWMMPERASVSSLVLLLAIKAAFDNVPPPRKLPPILMMRNPGIQADITAIEQATGARFVKEEVWWNGSNANPHWRFLAGAYRRIPVFFFIRGSGSVEDAKDAKFSAIGQAMADWDEVVGKYRTPQTGPFIGPESYFQTPDEYLEGAQSSGDAFKKTHR